MVNTRSLVALIFWRMSYMRLGTHPPVVRHVVHGLSMVLLFFEPRISNLRLILFPRLANPVSVLVPLTWHDYLAAQGQHQKRKTHRCNRCLSFPCSAINHTDHRLVMLGRNISIDEVKSYDLIGKWPCCLVPWSPTLPDSWNIGEMMFLECFWPHEWEDQGH